MNVKDIRRINARMLSSEAGGITALASKLGKAQSQISHIIGSKPRKNIGDRLASEIEYAFNKPNGWLDKEHREISEQEDIYGLNKYILKLSWVPVIAWSQVSSWETDKDTILRNVQSYVPITLDVSQSVFGLQVSGDSMEAASPMSFPDRSIIVIDPEVEASSGTYVVASQTKDETPTFKQYVVDSDKPYLKPLNSRYPILGLHDESQIFGVVRQMMLTVET